MLLCPCSSSGWERATSQRRYSPRIAVGRGTVPSCGDCCLSEERGGSQRLSRQSLRKVLAAARKLCFEPKLVAEKL